MVAFEDLRFLYRDLFVRAIRDLRPTLTVREFLEELAHVLWHAGIQHSPTAVFSVVDPRSMMRA